MDRTKKKLTRSTSDRVVSGVLGGWAKFFNIDASALRIGYVLLSILSAAFPGILVYIICLIVIPNEE